MHHGIAQVENRQVAEMGQLRRSPPVMLLVGIGAISVGALYGYDISSIACALMFIRVDFGLSPAGQEMVVTAAGLSAILGAAGGGWLANVIGRKKSMLLAVIAYAVCALLGAVSVSVSMLVGARLLLGLAIGVSIVVVPVFVAESAPAAVRGSLLVACGVATIIGIIAGYLVGYLLAGTHSWRAMLGLAALPAVLIAVLLVPIPDTARWYLLKNRVGDARRVLRMLTPDAPVEQELAQLSRALREEKQQRTGVLGELLRRPYLRATIFIVALGFLSQATGINAIAYYSPRLFEKMRFTGDFALFILPALVQTGELITKLAALLLIDRLGRRPILLAGIAVMVAADTVLAGVFIAGSSATTPLMLAGFTGTLLFDVGYAFGFGSLLWVYAGESLPTRLRSTGASVMLTSNLVASAITTSVFLSMLSSLGGAATFALFGILAVISLWFVYRCAPETRGRQLEDIRHLWENSAERR